MAVITPLQKARLQYEPKLPGMLRHGISEICVREGEETADSPYRRPAGLHV